MVAVMVYADSGNLVNVPVYLHDELPQQVGERVVADHAERNFTELLPKEHSYYTYMGSFTTPPCTESIRWFVMKTPISIKPEVLPSLNGSLEETIAQSKSCSAAKFPLNQG